MNRILSYLKIKSSTKITDEETLKFAKRSSIVMISFSLLLPILLALPASALVPSAPTDLIVDTSTQTPALSWTTVPDASSYNIYRQGQNIGSSTTNSYTDYAAVNLSPNNYTYYVTAVNSDGQSGSSNSVTVPISAPVFKITSARSTIIEADDDPLNFVITTEGGDPNNPTATPIITETGSMPTGITFTDNGDGTASLSGKAADDTHGNYQITITATAGNQVYVQQFTIYTTSFITPSSTAQSATVNYSISITALPTNFFVTNETVSPTSGQTMVSCGGDSELVNGNCVFYYVLNGGQTATLNFTATDNNGCANNGQDTFSVSTYSPSVGTHSLGNSTVKVLDCVAVPSAPTNLSVNASTQTPILSWDSADDTTSYNIYDNGVLIGSSSSTTYTDTSPEAGVNSYYVTAVNVSGESEPSNIVTINTSGAPIFTSTDSDTETYGVPFSFTITTTGSSIPSIKKVAGSGNLPAGVTLKDNKDGTATLSGNLSRNSNSGIYTFTIQAKNSAGITTQAFTLTITKAPVIKKVSKKTAKIGTNFSQNIAASGYELPSITVVGLPAGLNFVDNGDGTGIISGTPAVGTKGQYSVTINAVNSEGGATTSFQLKIK